MINRLNAFWAASAIGSLSAPIGGEYTFSIQARSSMVTPGADRPWPGSRRAP